MPRIKIEGNNKLSGKITISGAKNSAVALIPAAILCDEEVILEKLLESQKIIDILDDIDYDTQEMQTILSRNLPSETYEILKKYLDDNSYLKTIWSYYDDE